MSNEPMRLPFLDDDDHQELAPSRFAELDKRITKLRLEERHQRTIYTGQLYELADALREMRETQAYLDAGYSRLEDYLHANHPALSPSRARCLATAARELDRPLFESAAVRLGDSGFDALSQLKSLSPDMFAHVAERLLSADLDRHVDSALAPITLATLQQMVKQLKVEIRNEVRAPRAQRREPGTSAEQARSNGDEAIGGRKPRAERALAQLTQLDRRSDVVAPLALPDATEPSTAERSQAQAIQVTEPDVIERPDPHAIAVAAAQLTAQLRHLLQLGTRHDLTAGLQAACEELELVLGRLLDRFDEESEDDASR